VFFINQGENRAVATAQNRKVFLNDIFIFSLCTIIVTRKIEIANRRIKPWLEQSRLGEFK